MKLFAIAAAAAVAITSFSAVPASAQRERVVTRTTVTRHVNYRHEMRHRGWRTKRVCRTHWHHHRRVRVCRTIRVQR